MHELGLVTHVVRAIEEIGKEEKLTEVASVTLEIGEVSGVIPDLSLIHISSVRGCSLKSERGV